MAPRLKKAPASTRGGCSGRLLGVLVMRRFVGTAVFAGCTLVAGSTAAAPAAADSATARPTESAVAVQQVQFPVPRFRDEVAMVLVGTALIALGGVVRRSA